MPRERAKCHPLRATKGHGRILREESEVSVEMGRSVTTCPGRHRVVLTLR